MTVNMIPADYSQYVEDGIPTGEALNFIADLSPLQRQLFQEADFHFGGGSLLKKRDETTGTNLGADLLNAEDDTIRDFAYRVIDQLEISGQRISPELWNGNTKVQGLWTKWDTKLQEEYIHQRAKDAAEKRWNLAILHAHNMTGQGYTEEEALSKYPDASMNIPELMEHIIEAQEYETDAMTHIADVNSTAEGMSITYEDGRELVIDLVSLNSQFSGAGFQAPRDNYATVRLLQYDDESAEAIAAAARVTDLGVMLREINAIESMQDYTIHYKSVVNLADQTTPYAQDKVWKEQWGTKANDTEMNRITDELVIGRKERIITEQEYTYQIKHDGKAYSFRTKDALLADPSQWFDSNYMAVPTVLGQILAEKLVHSSQMPSKHVSTYTLKAIEPLAVFDEETLRRKIEYAMWTWENERKEATTQLHFTNAQWQTVFNAYATKRAALNGIKRIETESIAPIMQPDNRTVLRIQLNANRSKAIPYNMEASFELGDLIKHDKFGIGIVESVDTANMKIKEIIEAKKKKEELQYNKINVAFADQSRVLTHNQEI